MSEGITGESSAAPAAASTPAAPTSVDAALDQSFAASLTTEAAPDAPTPPAAPEGAPTTEAVPQEEVAPVAPEGTEKPTGPIPFEVHHKALENARLKASQETEARLTQEYQRDVAPVMSAAKAIANDVTSGSIEGLTQLIREYGEHPQLGPQLRSLFGRMLGQQRGQQPAASQQTPPIANEPEPQPDFEYRNPDGTVAMFYSAQQQQRRDEWNARRTEALIQQRLQPVQEHVQTQKHQEHLRQMQAKAWTDATTLLAEFRSDPDFVAHEALVQEKLAANPRLSLDRAWNDVYRTVVVPKKVQQGRHEFVQQAAKKSAGSTVDPAASAPAQPKRPRTVDEALEQSFSGLS